MPTQTAQMAKAAHKKLKAQTTQSAQMAQIWTQMVQISQVWTQMAQTAHFYVGCT